MRNFEYIKVKNDNLKLAERNIYTSEEFGKVCEVLDKVVKGKELADDVDSFGYYATRLDTLLTNLSFGYRDKVRAKVILLNNILWGYSLNGETPDVVDSYIDMILKICIGKVVTL